MPVAGRPAYESEQAMSTPETPSILPKDEANNFRPLVRNPRHRWFAAESNRAEDGWFGPHKTIEGAAIDCLSNVGGRVCFVTQGRKLTKAEIEETEAEYEWEVDPDSAFQIRLPNKPISNSGG